MADSQDDESDSSNVGARPRGGVPMPEWKCLEGLRQLVKLIEPFDEHALAFFHTGFLRVLDEFLDQLIRWTEGAASPELKRLAGKALAERVRLLATQEQQRARSNEGFDTMLQAFGDKRGARAPRDFRKAEAAISLLQYP